MDLKLVSKKINSYQGRANPGLFPDICSAFFMPFFLCRGEENTAESAFKLNIPVKVKKWKGAPRYDGLSKGNQHHQGGALSMKLKKSEGQNLSE
jgi:hypothetical protein